MNKVCKRLYILFCHEMHFSLFVTKLQVHRQPSKQCLNSYRIHDFTDKPSIFALETISGDRIRKTLNSITVAARDCAETEAERRLYTAVTRL
jgi:hypothetical protein